MAAISISLLGAHEHVAEENVDLWGTLVEDYDSLLWASGVLGADFKRIKSAS